MVLIAAGLVALAATPLAAVLARRVGVMDKPGPLKVHARPVPYLGGLAVFAGAAVGMARARPSLLVPIALALALGLADDVHELPPAVRLGCEVAVGLSAAAVVDTRLPGVLGPLAVTALAVLLINAVNLIDGLDGLAGGVGLASALGFAAVLHGDDRTVALALAAALAGFLVFNRPPARIYLGDAGAYFLGAALALLLAASARQGRPAAVPVAALLLVGVPVAETVFAVIRRLRARAPLFEGDRGHVYDKLVDRGWPALWASLTMVLAQGCLAVLARVASELATAAAVAVVAACMAGLIAAGGAGGFLAPTYRRSLS